MARSVRFSATMAHVKPPHPWLLALVAVLAIGGGLFLPRAEGAETVTQSYGRAQKAWQTGNGKAAVQILLTTVKRFPDHQPSHALLGQIYLKSGQLQLATKQFKAVTPENVPADSAYDYGALMFAAGDCRRSVAALARVPAKGRTGSLSSFYRGICQLRAKDHAKALQSLRLATDLPANLRTIQVKALKQAQSGLIAERRPPAPPIAPSPAAAPAAVASDPLAPPPMPMSQEMAATDHPAVAPPPLATTFAPPPLPGLPGDVLPSLPASPSGVITPTAQYQNNSRSQSFFGYGADAPITDRIDVAATGMLRLAREKGKPLGTLPEFRLLADAGEVFLHSRNSQVGYASYGDDPTSVRVIAGGPPPQSLRHLAMGGEASGVLPLGAAAYVQGGYRYLDAHVDSLDSNRGATISGPFATAEAYTPRLGDLQLTTSMGQYQDRLTQNQLQEVAAILRYSHAIGASANAELTLTYVGDSATPAPPAAAQAKAEATFAASRDGAWRTATGLAGPSQYVGAIEAARLKLGRTFDRLTLLAQGVSTLYQPSRADSPRLKEESGLFGDLALVRTFEFGLTFTVDGKVGQLTNYRATVISPGTPIPDPSKGAAAVAGLPTVIAVAPAGTLASLTIDGRIAPVDWGFLLVRFAYTRQSFAGLDPTLQDRFLSVVPEDVRSLLLALNLSKSF